jgi:hypothetical protein
MEDRRGEADLEGDEPNREMLDNEELESNEEEGPCPPPPPNPEFAPLILLPNELPDGKRGRGAKVGS